jgi:hypothetical protein
VRPPAGDRLDDALNLFHDAAWSCPGGKPQVTAEQLAYWLTVVEPWFRDELMPRRLPTVPKEYRPAHPKKVRVASALQSSTIPAPIRRDVVTRDGWECQRCGRSIYGIRAGLQHRRPRGAGGSTRLHTMANLVLLCGWADDPDTCTHLVERLDRAGATRDGWLVPNGVAPEEWPVLRYGRYWMQPGSEWVPALPHPDQIERGAVACPTS